MSNYLVLARKYRPSNFDDVVGQKHITDLLKQAIESGRVAHSYLFCGPRGIGKTSCARILAQCLNAENGPTVNPDPDSSISKEIAKGTSFDVMEIDGASNRGIDEIRTLRESVKFAPSYAKYKIYIVDEVHMLTTEAFNALLKTLEEPPEHVKFIFATTDPNKLPATIVSRCQRYDFKRITLNDIIGQLKSVCLKEKLTIDEGALLSIAKAAQGSMRDGLSILDQLSAITSHEIKNEDVYSMLGIVETDLLFSLVDSLGEGNCLDALQKLDEMIDKGKDIKQLSKDITEHFRHLMIIKIGGKSLGKLVDYPASVKDMFLEQTKKFTLGKIIQSIELLIQSQDIARVTETVRMPLEVTFAKMTYDQMKTKTAEDLPKAVNKQKSGFTQSTVVNSNKGQVDLTPVLSSHDKAEIEMKSEPEAQPEPVPESETLTSEKDIIDDGEELSMDVIIRDWDKLTHAVSQQKMSLATYLQEGTPVAMKGNELTIGFPAKCSFQKSSLESANNVMMVQDIFSKKLNQSIRLKYVIKDNVPPRKEDSSVENVLNEFQGKVVNRWHNE